jgi:hypothetical protein
MRNKRTFGIPLTPATQGEDRDDGALKIVSLSTTQ